MTIWWVLVLLLIVARSRLCGYDRAGLWLALRFFRRFSGHFEDFL